VSRGVTETMTAMTLGDVRFRYASNLPDVLQIPKFSVSNGERVFLYGPSGSGKSTLLGLVGGLFLPVSGSVSVLGQSFQEMSQAQRDKFRAENIGFIFQIFNLIPYLSVLDNVILPTKFGRPISKGFTSIEAEADFLMEQLGISAIKTKKVSNLSIGQQQRVAAARALIGSPGLIIADEPTSALDADARAGFLQVLFDQAKREGSSILFVSHDRSLASQFDRQVALHDVNKVASPYDIGAT
jgi:putative ABC transport system ATP-binding protein